MKANYFTSQKNISNNTHFCDIFVDVDLLVFHHGFDVFLATTTRYRSRFWLCLEHCEISSSGARTQLWLLQLNWTEFVNFFVVCTAPIGLLRAAGAQRAQTFSSRVILWQVSFTQFIIFSPILYFWIYCKF